MRHILNISLPMEMIESIKDEVKEGQFSSVSEFIRDLVRKHQSDRLARAIKRDSKLFRQGKLKVFEVKSFKDVL